jgi:cyclic pyranopterin phosphate synthase
MRMSINDQLQRPLRDLRISVIDRCNFRCPYCMPEDQFHQAYQFLDKNEWLSFDEIERLVKIFVGLGVQKIRLTGGEPLLRPNLDELIQRLYAIDGIKDLALTTNGSLLSEQAMKLKKAGLRRLTVSLDSLDSEVFKTLSGGKGSVEKVLTGIDAARHAGFESVKINTVIQRGVNDHTYMDLVRFARDEGHTVRFIEYMDVGNQNHWNQAQVVSSKEIIARIQEHYPIEPIGGTEGGETSERFRFLDDKGEIGFVSSVSHPFCGTCNRARISADGKIYTCLFATQGTDLKEALRSGSDDTFLAHLIRVVWMKRDDRYSEQRAQIHQEHRPVNKIEMFRIGG